MKPRIKWTPTKRGFIARTQGGEITVELVNKKHYWDIRVNGQNRRIGSSEGSAKRYGREFL